MDISSKVLAAHALIAAAIKDFHAKFMGESMELNCDLDNEEIEKLARMLLQLESDCISAKQLARIIEQWT